MQTTAGGPAGMIPAHVLRELRYLEIATAKKIQTPRLGPYTSPARGTGFDFDQHRPYQPGDDVRRIDWNVTARLNAPFLRQTHAERELNVVIAVDLSRSMEVGSAQHSKRETLTFITASLLFSAAADQINTGFLAFSNIVHLWSPPRRGPGRAWRILEGVWELEPASAGTALRPALRHLSANLKTMSVVFLISDFITDEDRLFASPEMRLLASRHDLIAVVLEDPSEVALPPGGGYIRVREPESGTYRVVELSDRTRAAYSESVARRRKAIAGACYGLPAECVFISSDKSASEPLLEVLARRKRR